MISAAQKIVDGATAGDVRSETANKVFLGNMTTVLLLSGRVEPHRAHLGGTFAPKGPKNSQKGKTAA
jgi:hypothetical protein